MAHLVLLVRLDLLVHLEGMVEMVVTELMVEMVKMDKVSLVLQASLAILVLWVQEVFREKWVKRDHLEFPEIKVLKERKAPEVCQGCKLLARKELLVCQDPKEM